MYFKSSRRACDLVIVNTFSLEQTCYTEFDILVVVTFIF